MRSLALLAAMSGALAAVAQDPPAETAHAKAIRETAAMVRNTETQALARKHGLHVLNVTWEDTGRYKDSALGPNISDMTIQVQHAGPDGKCRLHLMPVIRFPNFDDKSADLSPDKFQLLVGNHKGEALKSVTLREFLGNLRTHLTKGESWGGEATSLLADRDTHVLVSAQACFLPVPPEGEATFNPVLFNYQARRRDPAVLTILATREGTSVTVIDGTRDRFETGGGPGQRLFFNAKGQRAILTGKRLSDFVADTKRDPAKQPAPEANEQSGLNMVLLIQVPLKQRHPMPRHWLGAEGAGGPQTKSAREKGDVENAVIGHGKVEGPFTEIDGMEIRRDARHPVRVTVQFYKATSDGVVTEKDMKEIAAQIDKVYQHADYVGSLVTQGHTGRPTEYDGPKTPRPAWWPGFWKRHELATGLTREDTMRLLRKDHGAEWDPADEPELSREADALVKRLEEEAKAERE